jgi:two-component system LytT family response regulator
MKLSTGKQELLIKDKMVIRFVAKGSFSELYLVNGRSIMLQLSLDNIEEQLANSSFIRIHANHLVNVEHISSIPEKASNGIQLSNGVNIPVGDKRLVQLKEIIENHINPKT